MCSIFLSNNLDEFLTLVDLNQPRGKFSFSYSTFKDGVFEIVKKDFGLFDKSVIKNTENIIHIGHCQAPTGGLVKDINRVHPAEDHNSFLFHNGIVKPDFLKQKNWTGWDTLFILKYINSSYGYEAFEIIQGSIACLYFDKDGLPYDFSFYRNSLCPLYLKHSDDILSLSSCLKKDDKSYRLIDPNVVYKIKDMKIVEELKLLDVNKVYSLGNKI